jgi:hypothetical protein
MLSPAFVIFMRWQALVAWALMAAAVPNAIVIVSVPPLSGLLPASFVGGLAPAAQILFLAIAQLPPGSLPGLVFYGTYEVLLPTFGSDALAAHAAALAVPWLMLGEWVARAGRRRRGQRRPPSARSWAGTAEP